MWKDNGVRNGVDLKGSDETVVAHQKDTKNQVHTSEGNNQKIKTISCLLSKMTLDYDTIEI